jgi:hypothetical protein
MGAFQPIRSHLSVAQLQGCGVQLRHTLQARLQLCLLPRRPWLGAVTPFALTSPSQFHADPPPELTSGRYLKDYNEVKAIGAFISTERTAEQTDLGYFYADNFIALWNRGLRDIASAHVANIGDSSRLFALTSLAIADAAITAWENKFSYVFWRPVTAIQEGDNDGNSRTHGDPTWQPFINTPPYPEYTSGANNLTGAVTRMLALFFGTNKMAFSLSSTFPQAIQKTRNYTHFSDVADDVVNVRIYQGIHFRTADEVGRKQGKNVAEWVFNNFLRPVE